MSGDAEREAGEEGQESVDPSAPLANRFTRGTLGGCAGIICVLALPALLFLPIEQWNLPFWVARLLPLAGFAVVALGAWLLARVPAGAGPRHHDPLHPLTSEGRSPVMELPATAANRLGFVCVVALLLLCAAGYLIGGATSGVGLGLLTGTLLACTAGFALVVYGVLAISRTLPAPAWRWVRIALRGGPLAHAVPIAVLGGVAMIWSLFVASEAGYLWARIGAALFILVAVLSGPTLQRLPSRDRLDGGSGRPGRARLPRRPGGS